MIALVLVSCLGIMGAFAGLVSIMAIGIFRAFVPEGYRHGDLESTEQE